MLETWRKWIPDAMLALLFAYVVFLGFATLDELMGWQIVTPYFK
ncbi:MAG: hypothetical protein P9L99_12945 [Candidatus Lernaella stagnicola]|nr:hypothetical protein [Candidatus Lernaella stagnicola]